MTTCDCDDPWTNHKGVGFVWVNNGPAHEVPDPPTLAEEKGTT